MAKGILGVPRKHTSQREAISKVGGWRDCRGARILTRWVSAHLGWGGQRIIDFQGISVEDMLLSSTSPRPGSPGEEAVGNQETCPKLSKLITNHRKANPSSSVVNMRTFLGGRRMPFQQTGPGPSEAAEHAQLPGCVGLLVREKLKDVPAPQAPGPRGDPRWVGGASDKRSAYPSSPAPCQAPVDCEPAASCPGNRRSASSSGSFCQPADPIARSPLPRDFRVGLEAERQQKMAERIQTAPEAGLWGRSTRGSAEAVRLSWAWGDRELECGPAPDEAPLGVWPRSQGLREVRSLSGGQGSSSPSGAGVYGGVCTLLNEHGPRKGWDRRDDTALQSWGSPALGADHRGRLRHGKGVHNLVEMWCGAS